MVDTQWNTRILGAVLVLGCACTCDEYETAECFEAVESRIARFEVTLGTGSDSSDADIYLCVARHSSTAPSCAELSSFGNDFMEDEVETYTADIEVQPGDLDRWWIENRGGAFGIIIANNDWDLASIAVDAVTFVDGQEVVWRIYEETEICADTLDAGDKWEPMACS